MTYRVVQEALTNVWKHSEAKRAEVSVEFDIDKTTVTISDDGKGFEIKEDSGFVQAGRIGLAGMQERAELLGANLVIQSKPGSGTKAILEIPEERWTG